MHTVCLPLGVRRNERGHGFEMCAVTCFAAVSEPPASSVASNATLAAKSARASAYFCKRCACSSRSSIIICLYCISSSAEGAGGMGAGGGSTTTVPAAPAFACSAFRQASSGAGPLVNASAPLAAELPEQEGAQPLMFERGERTLR